MKINRIQSLLLNYTMTILLFLCLIVVAKESSNIVSVFHLLDSHQRKCVVIDAGHGGIDPGKVGINGVLEKDINLSIALKVKKYLEQQDVIVILTRENDNGLYQETSSNKKQEDLNNRIHLINSANAALAVSIHQNSYTSPLVEGIQVFYYQNSSQGEYIASLMQEQLILGMQPNKEREAKPDSSYYLLKHSSIPMVIVECGFLSHPEEANLLTLNAYQEKMAWNISLGILKYLNHDDVYSAKRHMHLSAYAVFPFHYIEPSTY